MTVGTTIKAMTVGTIITPLLIVMAIAIIILGCLRILSEMISIKSISPMKKRRLIKIRESDIPKILAKEMKPKITQIDKLMKIKRNKGELDQAIGNILEWGSPPISTEIKTHIDKIKNKTPIDLSGISKCYNCGENIMKKEIFCPFCGDKII